MKFGIISLNQRENLRGRMQTRRPQPSFVRTSSYAESIGPYSLNGNSSISVVQASSLFQSQKPKTHESVSYGSEIPNQKSTMFCTSLHSSSLTSSDTIQQLTNTFFLPYRPTFNQIIPGVNSTPGSSLLPGEGPIHGHDNDNLVENFLDFPDIPPEISDGSFQGLHNQKDCLTPTERLQLQNLSKELDILIDDDNENSRLDEMYEVPQISPTPVIESNYSRSPLSPISQANNTMCSTHQPPEAATAVTSHKQRIRWTTELHDLFVDAVEKLGGPKNATPKGILNIMNVEGLSIYHVKSHLQKYRLAKTLPDLKEDETASGSDKQLTEALLTQIEVQKQLHLQLKAQKELQLRIEQHGESLRRLMEEQQKAGGALIPTKESEQLPVSSSTAGVSSPNLEEPRTDCTSSQSSKHKASDTNESERPRCQKRHRGESTAKSCSTDTTIDNAEQ